MPPHLPGAPPVDPVAMALRDPELIAASAVPYLPPSIVDPTPTASPAVFDARAMVEATRRKVENPAHPHSSKPTHESWAGVDAARTAMRRKRRRNSFIGRVAALAFLAALAGGGYLTYREYQSDQNATGSGSVNP